MTQKTKAFFLPKQPKNILPDFIIIGGMKCGTTSLYYYLNSHPEISMSTEKELNFFIEQRNWCKGVDWYQSQFRGSAKIYGEASPNYTYYPCWVGVPQRMYQLLPNAKLIYILRDPVERIISQYVHLYACGRENKSFTETLADLEYNPYNSYVSRSRYFWQLKQYLEYYPLSNILILTSEELLNHPQETLSRACNFLEVSDDSKLMKYNFKFHTSFYKRRKNNLGKAITNLSLTKKINNLPYGIRDHVEKLVYFPFSTPVKKPKLDQDLQNRLIKYLKNDIDQLRDCTGQAFSGWCV